MKIIVDTNVWSEALHKKSQQSEYVDELSALIEEGRVELLGIVQMEILCGIRDAQVFRKLESLLSVFPVRRLDSEVFVLAAQFFNKCRSHGIQGSNSDFIICAASVIWKCPILTKDKDFTHYQKHLPIELAAPRSIG